MSEDETRNLENLEEQEFHNILNITVDELMQKAWQEQWKIKNVEFWLKVKNAQNFEGLLNHIEDIKIHLENIAEKI